MNTCGYGVIWLANGQTSTPPPPPPDPIIPAKQAEAQLTPPPPTLEFSPAAYAYVNFPEWLFINGSIWHTFTKPATACNAGGCTTATATATPTSVTWYTGEPGMSPTICYGPGTPYNLSLPFSAQSTSCSHTYTAASTGEPVKAIVTWAVTWSGPDGSGGSLPNIQTSGTATLAVDQIESVIGG
jgi:hypothetical protein